MTGSSSFAARVREEILDFFAANPFLLVSERRLASLLCRPPHLVREAVSLLEDEGLLKHRDEDTLIGLWEAGERTPRC